MKMIDNWLSHLWRAWSVRMVYLATIPGLSWPLIPQDMRDSLPPWLVSAFAVMAAGSIIFARVVAQPNSLPKGEGK
jgi:hypothetical protein